MSVAKKYDISLPITPGYLDKFPILNANLKNGYASSKIFKEFGGCKATIGHNYCAAVNFFVYALNYGCLVTFRKTIDQLQSFMWYRFVYNKMCTRNFSQKK